MAGPGFQQRGDGNAKPDYITMPPPPRMPGTMTPGAGGSRGSSPLHSPRIPFVAGEGTPTMSPLDAFAAQSRLLAKQLDEESKRIGRRVSRLPHDQVAEHLARRERHLSPPMPQHGDLPGDLSPLEEDAGGEKPEIEMVPPEFRPRSFYPRFSAVTAPSETSSLPPLSPRLDEFSTPMEHSISQADYFATARSASPEPSLTEIKAAGRPSLESMSQSSYARSQSSFDSNHRQTDLQRGASIESSQSSKSMYASQHGALLPPNPPYARKTPSIRSVDSDNESSGSRGPENDLARKASNGSGISGPISPTSPTMRHPKIRRTPSQGSEMSINNNRLSRPHFNFSRPMSRQDRVPSRMSSIDSHTNPRNIEASLPTPASAYEPLTPTSFNDAQSVYGSIYGGDEQPRQSEDIARTYTHATFSLPRGRMVSRDSVPLDELMPNFSWDGQQASTNKGLSPNHTSTWPKQSDNTSLSQPSRDDAPRMPGSFEPVRPSMDSIRSVPAPAPPPSASRNHNMNRHSMTSMSAASMNSGSTIKASSHRKQKSEAEGEMTPEDHLAVGIASHDKGSINKSTYHFRLAANGGNATAMMMYALACRHGWGMRPSPSEGVKWLRAAIEKEQLEMADDADDSNLTPDERAAKKARKAQFALSVYELGVSHMNGWGIEQDKALALKCYEIAASWGDADAMAETAFCYAQGQGCKKDLHKAARWYRQAEKKGMSMVGQSWIYKSKYDEDPATADGRGRGDKKDKDADKKKRDKSRTRSIFGRKKA